MTGEACGLRKRMLLKTLFQIRWHAISYKPASYVVTPSDLPVYARLPAPAACVLRRPHPVHT